MTQRSESMMGLLFLLTLYAAIRDSHAKVVDTRTVTINQWSATEWTAPA